MALHAVPTPVEHCPQSAAVERKSCTVRPTLARATFWSEPVSLVSLMSFLARGSCASSHLAVTATIMRSVVWIATSRSLLGIKLIVKD